MTVVKDGGAEFTPCPEGLHQAVCVDQVDLGEMPTQFGIKHKIKLVFQVDKVDPTTKKRFEVHARYNASLNEKATLSKHLESWRGRKFTKEERGGFDLERLVSGNAQLQITHNLTDKGTYANIAAIVPLSTGQTKMLPLEYVREKDRPKTGAQPAAQSQDVDDDVPF